MSVHEVRSLLLSPQTRARVYTYVRFRNASKDFLFQVHWIHKRTGTVLSSDDTIDLEDTFNPTIDGNYKYKIRREFFGDR